MKRKSVFILSFLAISISSALAFDPHKHDLEITLPPGGRIVATITFNSGWEHVMLISRANNDQGIVSWNNFLDNANKKLDNPKRDVRFDWHNPGDTPFMIYFTGNFKNAPYPTGLPWNNYDAGHIKITSDQTHGTTRNLIVVWGDNSVSAAISVTPLPSSEPRVQ
jgi:hypothetical protein